MNLSKFLEFAKNGKFVDVNLILVDNNHTIKLATYRSILASASDDYSNLFSKGKTEFIIHSKNSSEALNQIMSFYSDQKINFNLYPDVKLTLADKYQNIEIQAHRLVLASASEYFLKLFTFGDNYQETAFRIQIDDAVIARDLIMSFYGLNVNPDPIHLLKMIKCKSFFCVDLDPKQLYGLKVPPEGFDLLLEIMDLFDHINDLNLMATINRNIPKEYALLNFTEEFVKELIEFRKQKMICGYADGTIKLLDVETGECLRTFEGHTNTVKSIRLFANNTRMISGSYDDTVKLWNMETGQCLHTFVGNIYWTRTITLFTDHTKILLVHDAYAIILWHMETGQRLRSFNGHTSEILLMKLFSDETRFVSISIHKIIKIWDVETGKCLHTFNFTDHFRTQEIHLSYDSTQLFVDGERMIFGAWGKKINFWDVETGQHLRMFEPNITWNDSIMLFAENTKMISWGYNCTFELWSMKTGQCLRIFQGHTSGICLVLLFEDNTKMVSWSNDGTIKIWNMDTGQCLHTFENHANWNTISRLFANNTRMVSTSIDKMIKVWNLETGELSQSFEQTELITSIELFAAYD